MKKHNTQPALKVTLRLLISIFLMSIMDKVTLYNVKEVALSDKPRENDHPVLVCRAF